MKLREIIRNILGAFADGAILFPILALLTLKAGFSGFTVLWTTGAVYIFASLFFRVPMAVQPLKSIAIAAVSVGASFAEVRLSGIFLGAYCLLICFFDVDRIAKKVPKAIIHELQAGLGILLVLQGVKALGGWSSLVDQTQGMLVLVGTGLMLLFPEVKRIPVLGVVATIGLFVAALFPQAVSSETILISPMTDSGVRFGLILSLLLPQIVLTSANSVLATKDVCQRYFGENASRVTVRKLLYSIGFGNVIVGLLGGMPFCHGSGGVTAHVRGGSTKYGSTVIMGAVLLFLAVIQYIQGAQVLIYPTALVSALLLATGVFHCKLAGPTFSTTTGKFKIILSILITVWTANLLWVLGFGLFFEWIVSAKNRFKPALRLEVQR